MHMTETDTGSYQQAFNQVQEMLKAREFSIALQQIDAILEVHPRDVKVNFLRAVALRNLGNADEAVSLLQRLSDATKDIASIQQELGISLYTIGRMDDAIAALRKAVKIDSNLGASWQLLGELLYREDDEADAEAAFQQQLAVSHRHPGIMEALRLVKKERYGMAEGICRDFLIRNPDDVTVIRLLAEIGIKLGIRHDPEILLERCLELAPDFHLARNTYANALGKAQKYEQALEQISYLEKVEPHNLSHSVLAASILVMIGDYQGAVSRYEDLLKRVPNHAQLHTSYGHALKTLGRREDAIAAYRSAIRIRADLGDAWWSLANLKTFTFSSDEIAQMQMLIGAENMDPRDFFHLCFALGKALEDKHSFDLSFEYYTRGNEVKCRQEGYEADETGAETQALITICTPELMNSKAGFGCPDPDPIFIVGLPRSGSTLLEQILASHSQVDGTSELREMMAIARRLGGKRNRDDQSQFPGVLWNLSESECRELGEEYLDRTRIQRQDAPFFIDKMPNNFQNVALITMLLPNAKIIDSRRHPLATCFSCYKQLFAAGQPFTYSQTDIARYYRDYVALMNHWGTVLPGKVLTVKYENVITDIESEVRRILDYCGLPFEEQCLAFHTTERAIRTASSEQVRQPIYTDAVNHWRNFQPYLDPMSQILGDLVTAHEKY
jgi:tetratricopeptide (TPR) repeat protein